MADNINDGGPAFPLNEDEKMFGSYGMSLRDWFAGQALQGLIMSNMIGHPDDLERENPYGYADAMLKAREGR